MKIDKLVITVAVIIAFAQIYYGYMDMNADNKFLADEPDIKQEIQVANQ
jgi:hypothetical protein